MQTVLAVIVIAAPALVLYVAPFLPAVVALVTKSTAPAPLKAGLLATLAVVTALVGAAIENGSGIELDKAFAARLAVTFALAVVTHYGLLKPIGLTGSEGKVSQINNGRFALGRAA